ncbi:unnamed protein product [Debaryomyces tyrocola]|nr:unnamed protein product [Debaryomyces tyrocola]
MANYDNVKYRPGRIQTINAEQEIVLKQVWAHYLKYFGYEVNISSEDIKFKESFIPSTTTIEYGEGTGDLGFSNGLVKTNTRGSLSSNASLKSSTKKKGFFQKGHTELPKVPANSKRMRDIETQNTTERYTPVTDASEEFKYMYYDYYKQGFESDEESEDDVSDMNSMDTFITASTSITDPGSYELVQGVEKQNVSAQILGSAPRLLQLKPNTKVIPCLSKYKPEEIHASLFKALRNDLFDNYLLKFVRARKFKYDEAIAMLSKSLDWRRNTLEVDEFLLEGDAPSYMNGTNKGFIKNFTVGKCYTRGVDKQKNPIVLFKARLNYSSDSPLEGTKRYALVIIEWSRLNLKDISESRDQCSVIFDLTGFSLKNNDLPAIKFLAEIFEAHFPEILGSILIHNAPWIFSTIWNLIKNWLDPVVASKIHFTKNIKDLNQFIDSDNLPESMGGKDPYAGEYPEPTVEDCHPPKPKDAVYRQIKKERNDNLVKFLETTKRWIESTNSDVSARYLQDKIDLGTKIAQSYVDLDPYVRIPGIYDRNGSIDLSI